VLLIINLLTLTEKKNHCNVECTAHFRKEVHMLCRTQCFSKRCQSKHEQEEGPRGEEREKISQADSMLSKEPDTA